MPRIPRDVLLVLLAIAGLVSPASAAPRWLRLSWTGAPESTMAVSWTDDAAGSGQVEYRATGGDVSTADATGTATGSSDLDATYVAEITGLTPSTLYDYRVHSGGAWSDWR